MSPVKVESAKSTREERVRAFVDKFNALCVVCAGNDGLPVFEVDSPQAITIAMPGGRWSQRPFIGGERFVPTGAYIGKTGDPIYKFRPELPNTDYSHIELKGKKIGAAFPEFEKWVKALDEAESLAGDAEAIKEARDKAAELEEQAFREALLNARADDPRFGSW